MVTRRLTTFERLLTPAQREQWATKRVIDYISPRGRWWRLGEDVGVVLINHKTKRPYVHLCVHPMGVSNPYEFWMALFMAIKWDELRVLTKANPFAGLFNDQDCQDRREYAEEEKRKRAERRELAQLS